MVSEKFETKFMASVFLARGITGTYLYMSNSTGGFSQLSYGSGLMSFLIAFLAISSAIIFISYGLTKKRYWSWLLGSLTALIYLTTDITMTILGIPQPVAEFVIDSFLVIYFLRRKNVFLHKSQSQKRFEGAREKKG